MEEFMNKLKAAAQAFAKNFMSDVWGNAMWAALLLLALWNYSDCDSIVDSAPTIMHEIAAVLFAVKGAVLLAGAAIVYYLHAIYQELKRQNSATDKKAKK